MVIIVDDEDRENEGDLAMSAEKITPAAINFMATYGRGLICVPMLGPRLEQLRLPMMTQDNTARLSTAFTVSVDVLKGATTGISAADSQKTSANPVTSSRFATWKVESSNARARQRHPLTLHG